MTASPQTQHWGPVREKFWWHVYHSDRWDRDKQNKHGLKLQQRQGKRFFLIQNIYNIKFRLEKQTLSPHPPPPPWEGIDIVHTLWYSNHEKNGLKALTSKFTLKIKSRVTEFMGIVESVVQTYYTVKNVLCPDLDLQEFKGFGRSTTYFTTC